MKKLLSILLLSLTIFTACQTGTKTQTNETSEETNTIEEESPFTYNRIEYEQALADGKTVFLDFFATWCPICIANKDNLAPALESVEDPNRVIFIVDYDNESELRAELEIFLQSSYLIIPNGNLEEKILVGPGYIQTDQYIEALEAAKNSSPSEEVTSETEESVE